MVKYLPFHVLLAQYPGLLLNITLEHISRTLLVVLLRILPGKSRQIDLGDLFEHTPAEQLLVTMLELIIDFLCGIDI